MNMSGRASRERARPDPMRREMRLALRQIGESAIIVLFFVLAAVLFPFGVGPEPNMLARMAPGVVWVTALARRHAVIRTPVHTGF